MESQPNLYWWWNLNLTSIDEDISTYPANLYWSRESQPNLQTGIDRGNLNLTCIDRGNLNLTCIDRGNLNLSC